MTVSTIRQSLHNYLEIANEKKVKAIYTMLEEDIKSSSLTYTKSLKKELDSRQEDFKSGKVKMVTAKESKNRIDKLIKNKTK